MENTVLLDYSGVELAAEDIEALYKRGYGRYNAIEFNLAMQDLMNADFSQENIFRNSQDFDQECGLVSGKLTAYKNGSFKLDEYAYIDPKKKDSYMLKSFAAVVLKIKEDMIYIKEIKNKKILDDDQVELVCSFWNDFYEEV